MLSLKPMSVAASPVRSRDSSCLTADFTSASAPSMLPLMSMASTRSSGLSSLAERGHLLRDSVLEDLEVALAKTLDEASAIGDDDRNEDGFDLRALRIAQVFRADVVDSLRPSANVATTRT